MSNSMLGYVELSQMCEISHGDPKNGDVPSDTSSLTDKTAILHHSLFVIEDISKHSKNNKDGTRPV